MVILIIFYRVSKSISNFIGDPSYHGSNRAVTQTKVQFQSTAKYNAQSLSILKNIQISWVRLESDDYDVTEFYVNTECENDFNITDAWVGVGFNDDPKMNGAHVFVCRNSFDSQWVRHYYANNYQLSLKNASDPTVGIIVSGVSSYQSNFTCRFVVDNRVAFFSEVDFTNAYITNAFGTG